jgi:ADP-ribose pyrophosphatase YjhB (NUDIX family)
MSETLLDGRFLSKFQCKHTDAVQPHAYNKDACLNCCAIGHDRSRCLKPVCSFGIILLCKNKELKILMVQRLQSIGFIEYIKGRYESTSLAAKLIEDMTTEEYEMLTSLSFENLWAKVWSGDLTTKYAVRSREIAEEKFKTTFSQLENVKPKRKELAWGFPKGHRHNCTECDICCASRELKEETNIILSEYCLEREIPYEETFTGMNGKIYKYLYFVAVLSEEAGYIDKDNILQCNEIGNIAWMSRSEANEHSQTESSDRKDIIQSVFARFGN